MVGLYNMRAYAIILAQRLLFDSDMGRLSSRTLGDLIVPGFMLTHTGGSHRTRVKRHVAVAGTERFETSVLRLL